MKKSFKLSLVLCLMGGGINLAANDNATLDTIEVNANAIGYSSLDSFDISNKNASHIRDIMRDIPGVYVGGTNNLNQKLYMRGVNDRGINITIDGARQRGNVFHHSADLILDTDLLKSVDVGVGVLSVVNSSGALGGSVAFTTANAFDLLEDGSSFGGKIKTSYSSNNKEWQKSLTSYGQYNGFGLLGYVNHKDYGYGKDGNGNEIGGDGKDLSYLIKASLEKDDSKANLSLEHNEYKGLYPFRAEFGGTNAVTKQRSQDLINQKMLRDTYTANYNYNPNELVDLNLRAYLTEHRLKWLPFSDEYVKANNTSTRIFDGGVRTYGVYLNNKSILENSGFTHTFKYGYEFYNTSSFMKESGSKSLDASGNIVTKNANLAPNDKAQNHSFYVEDTIAYGNLSVIPGIRFDYFKLTTLADNLKQTSYSFKNVSPAIAVDYKFNNGFNLFAGYSKVFRGPDPIESLRLTERQAASIIASKDLEPETGHAKEIGFGYKNSFDSHNVNFIAKYFHTEYQNLIKEMVSTTGKKGDPSYARVNGGKANVSGFELFAGYSYEDFKTSISYTTQKTDLRNKNDIKGGVLAYSDSGDKYTFNAEYFIRPIDLNIGYNLIYVTSKNIETFVKPSYAVSDVYLSYTPSFAKGLELNLSVNNIFNKAYYSHSQRVFGSDSWNDWEAGRDVRISFSYKF